MTITNAIALVALSAGAAIAGAVDAILPLAIAFTAINAVAAITAARLRGAP